jgi:hypothetical protein
MTDDEQPPLTNSGITEPGQGPPATSSAGNTSSSTPFGITASTSEAPLTSSGCSAMIADMAGGALTNTGTLRIESECPGVFVDLDMASRDTAIQSLKESDARLFQADDMVALVTGPALKAIVAARVDQVAKHGHTPDRDADLPLKHLPHHARSMLLDTVDLLEGPHRNLVVARRRLAKAAAMLMAAIDRVDLEIAKGE